MFCVTQNRLSRVTDYMPREDSSGISTKSAPVRRSKSNIALKGVHNKARKSKIETRNKTSRISQVGKARKSKVIQKAEPKPSKIADKTTHAS